MVTLNNFEENNKKHISLLMIEIGGKCKKKKERSLSLLIYTNGNENFHEYKTK